MLGAGVHAPLVLRVQGAAAPLFNRSSCLVCLPGLGFVPVPLSSAAHVQMLSSVLYPSLVLLVLWSSDWITDLWFVARHCVYRCGCSRLVSSPLARCVCLVPPAIGSPWGGETSLSCCPHEHVIEDCHLPPLSTLDPVVRVAAVTSAICIMLNR